MKLKQYEIRLIAHCLDIASDQFSNHVCNDFDLDAEEIQLTDREKRELVLGMALENGDPEEVRNGPTPKYTTDWCVMSYFARMFDGQEMPKVEPEPLPEEVARLNRRIAVLEKESLDLQNRLAGVKRTMKAAVNSL